MATRSKPSSAAQNIAQYIHWRQIEIDAKKNRDKFRKNGKLDDLVTTAGEEQYDGSLIYWLDNPIPLEDGRFVTGLEKRRSVSVFMDEEAAEALADTLDIVEEVSHLERVYDEDAFYAANQRGLITDEQLEGIQIRNEDFSLQVVIENAPG